MAAKGSKRIGILFIFKSRWIGGLYYLLNVIAACEYLPEEQQPELVIFYNKRTKGYLDGIKYSKSDYVEVDIDFDYKRYLKSLILNKNLFFVNEFTRHNLDVIFPFNDFVGKIKSEIKLMSWIPDFQHKFYPQYFGKSALMLRELRFRGIVSRSAGLILSSQSAYDHFMRFYKPTANLKVAIVRFTSIIETAKLPSAGSVREKYGLPGHYFIVCNQFYSHKNHFIVVKALKELKKRGKVCNVVFTSKPDQEKDAGLLIEIEQYIAENKLQTQVQLLGMLPRADQLALMKASIGVIQPSKFEGWSTVIEDAKTLQKRIIASNLPVHIEQLGEKGLFFDPDQATALADCIDIASATEGDENLWPSLVARTHEFATEFLKALYGS